MKKRIKEKSPATREKYWIKFLEWLIPVIFLFMGIPLGLISGGYLSTQFLTRFITNHNEPCLLEQIIIISGIVFGILYAFILALGGRFISRGIGEFIYLKRKSKDSTPAVIQHYRIDRDRKDEIKERLHFLEPYLLHLHAILLVGSSVYKKNTKDSDIDIVLVCKDNGFDRIREIIFQKEIDEQLSISHKNLIEYTVVDKSIVEDEFRNSTPFSYAMRYGIKLQSDGFIERIEKRHPAKVPSRKYILKALYSGIITQYYGSVKDTGKDIKKAHSTSGICTQKGLCQGHGPAERFLNVILKMLYITLPINGYMPLTKADLSYFSSIVYGEEISSRVDEIIYLVRSDTREITESQFSVFKELSTGLFLEILQYVGFTAEIKSLIRDVLYMKKGQHEKVKDTAYRRCII